MKPISFCISHIGAVRQNHEDNFMLEGKYIKPDVQKKMELQTNQFVSSFGMQSKSVQIYAISDGMGGHNAGEVASYITVEILSKLETALQGYIDIKELGEVCQKSLQEINKTVCSLSKNKPELKNMGATVTLLVKAENENIVLNLGDSRAYFFNGVVLKQITRDNTEGQRLYDLKVLTLEELELFPARNSLNRYIGMNIGQGTLSADQYINEATQRGWFLLCSDGLTSAVKNDEIADILSIYYKENQIEQAAQALLNSALKGINGRLGSRDNITIMIVRN